MARPSKCRKIGNLPKISEFQPIIKNGQVQEDKIILNLDEYETIRLIDKIGLSQEECSRFMDVARTTVQAIYNSARKKIAIALVEARPLQIEGGNYEVFEGHDHEVNRYACYKYKMSVKKRLKGESPMKVLIPVNDNKTAINEHFGRATYFMVYDTVAKSKKYILNPAKNAEGGAGLKAAQCIIDEGVETVITIRCGKNAVEVLEAGEINVLQAQGTDIDENILKYEKNELEALANIHGGFHGNMPSGIKGKNRGNN